MNSAVRQPVVWLNGRLLPVAEARLSPLDRGFLTGVGVFETLRSYRGRVFAITRHYERLRASCDLSNMEAPRADVFRAALEEVLAANVCSDARLRFTLSAGEASSNTSTMLATAEDLPVWPAAANVICVPWPHNERSPLAGAKSISYGENILALNWAKQRGANEGIFANTRGELCEGASSNIFIVRDGVLVTPPLSSGCLAGVTRALVLELAQRAGLAVQETPLPLAALADCDEAFLTSSTREVQPIAQADGKNISQAPGVISRQLIKLFQELTCGDADP